jgi:hypothetical protein
MIIFNKQQFLADPNGQSMPEGTAVPGGLTQAEIDQAIR